jgi:glycerol-3-phosphate dehydrogenase (NAD(P)+)
LASESQKTAETGQALFTTPFFRVYTGSDVAGVELGGALKNVIAIGSGISDGLGLGNNTRAALITRGIAEITRLGVKLGANPLTFAGLAGIGDLFLTCTSDLSRNHSLGVKLGMGMSLGEVLAGMRMVAEGVKTAKSAYDLARKLKVEMPITEQVYYVLYEDKPPRDAVKELMCRTPKDELEEGLFQWKSS